VELVKQIIVALSWVVKAVYEDPTLEFHWNAFSVEDYLRSQHKISVRLNTGLSFDITEFLQDKKPSKPYNFLFSAPQE
jgi:hypothetical protein